MGVLHTLVHNLLQEVSGGAPLISMVRIHLSHLNRFLLLRQTLVFQDGSIQPRL